MLQSPFACFQTLYTNKDSAENSDLQRQRDSGASGTGLLEFGSLSLTSAVELSDAITCKSQERFGE